MNELSTKVRWNEPHPQLGMSLMDHLFERLEGALTGRWKTSFKSAADIQNWREVWSVAFDKSNITPLEIKVGLENICDAEITKQHMKGWTPTAAEFIALCRHKQNIPACHQAYLPKPKPTSNEVGLAKIREMRDALANKMRVAA